MSPLDPAVQELTTLLQRLSTGGPASYFTSTDTQLLANSLIPSSPRNIKNLAFLALSKHAELVSKSLEDPPSFTKELEIWIPLWESWQPDTSPEELIPATALLASLFPLLPNIAAELLTRPLSWDIVTPEASQSEDTPRIDSLAYLLESAELQGPLQPVFADLLVQASGTKAGRKVIAGRVEEWLRGALSFGNDPGLAALCASALSKISGASLNSVEEIPSSNGDGDEGGPTMEGAGELELANKMMEYIITLRNRDSPALLPTLEGLSILSLRSNIKDHLAKSSKFLKSLISLSPIPAPKGGSLPVTPRGNMDPQSFDKLDKLVEPVETGLCYGVTAILVNLTTKKPVLSAEDQQIAKLRAMAISGKGKRRAPGGSGNGEDAGENDPLEEDGAVQDRVKRVIAAGVVPSLRGLVRGDSRLVKESLGRLCLNLVEDKENRMLFIKDGGFKVLSLVIRDLVATTTSTKSGNPESSQSNNGQSGSTSQTSSTDPDILPACQALAKLIITTPPHLLFPPPHTTSALDSLSPLYHLLINEKAGLLQHFEALMALTNLASIGPKLADRIVKATITFSSRDSGFLNSSKEDGISVVIKIEEALLSDNILVRRASMELICNLAGSPSGWSHWTGETHAPTPGSESDGTKVNKSKAVKSRLHIILVMTNVDDLPTRLAAGGALAVLSESKEVCRALLQLQEGRSSWKRVVGMLELDEIDDPDDEDSGEKIQVISSKPLDEGLVLRGVTILYNLLNYTFTDLDKEEKGKELEMMKEAEVEERLMNLVRMKMSRDVLEVVVECLKIIKQLK